MIFPHEALDDLNWENPLTEKLAALIVSDGTNIIDLVTGNIADSQVDIIHGSDGNGKYFEFNGTTSTAHFLLSSTALPQVPVQDNQTVTVIHDLVDDGTVSGAALVSVQSNSNRYWSMGAKTNATTLAGFTFGGKGYSRPLAKLMGQYTTQTARFEGLAATHFRDNNAPVFDQHNMTMVSGGTEPFKVLIGTRYTLANEATGKFYAIAYFKGDMSDEEIQSFHSNPFQVRETAVTESDNYGLKWGAANGLEVTGLLGNLTVDIELAADMPPSSTNMQLWDSRRVVGGGASSGGLGYLFNNNNAWTVGSAITNIKINSIPVVSLDAEIDAMVKGDVLSFDVLASGDTVLMGAHYNEAAASVPNLHLSSLRIADDNGIHLFDLNRTFGTLVQSETSTLQAKLIGFPEASGHVRAYGVSDGFPFRNQGYAEVPLWNPQLGFSYDVTFIAGSNPTIGLLGEEYQTGHYIRIQGIDIYFYYGNVGVNMRHNANLVEGVEYRILATINADGSGRLELHEEGVPFAGGLWEKNYAIGTFSQATPIYPFNFGRVLVSPAGYTDAIFVKAALTDFNGVDSRYYDFTAITNNTIVPDTAYHADGIPQNGTLVGFTDVYIPERSSTFIGKEFDGKSYVTFPVWTANGDFTVTGSFLFSHNSALVLGYTVDGSNVIGCIEGGTLRARLEGVPNLKLDAGGYTQSQRIDYVLDRTSGTVTLTVNNEVVGTGTNTDPFILDMFGAYNSPQSNFFDNVIGNHTLVEAGGDNRNYDFSDGSVVGQLTDVGVGAKHGVVTGTLIDRFDYTGYGEIVGYRLTGSTSFTFPTILCTDDFSCGIDFTAGNFWGDTMLIQASSHSGVNGFAIFVDANQRVRIYFNGQRTINTIYHTLTEGERFLVEVTRVGSVVTCLIDGVVKGTGTANPTTLQPTIQAVRRSSTRQSGDLTVHNFYVDANGTRRDWDCRLEGNAMVNGSIVPAIRESGGYNASIGNPETSGFMRIVPEDIALVGTGKDYAKLYDHILANGGKSNRQVAWVYGVTEDTGATLNTNTMIGGCTVKGMTPDAEVDLQVFSYSKDFMYKSVKFTQKVSGALAKAYNSTFTHGSNCFQYANSCTISGIYMTSGTNVLVDSIIYARVVQNGGELTLDQCLLDYGNNHLMANTYSNATTNYRNNRFRSNQPLTGNGTSNDLGGNQFGLGSAMDTWFTDTVNKDYSITTAGRTAIGTDTGWNGSEICGWANAPIDAGGTPEKNVGISFNSINVTKYDPNVLVVGTYDITTTQNNAIVSSYNLVVLATNIVGDVDLSTSFSTISISKYNPSVQAVKEIDVSTSKQSVRVIGKLFNVQTITNADIVSSKSVVRVKAHSATVVNSYQAQDIDIIATTHNITVFKHDTTIGAVSVQEANLNHTSTTITPHSFLVVNSYVPQDVNVAATKSNVIVMNFDGNIYAIEPAGEIDESENDSGTTMFNSLTQAITTNIARNIA